MKRTLILDSIAPYFSCSQGLETTIEILSRDIAIERKVACSGSVRPRTKRQLAARRGGIRRFSDKCAARLLHRLRNCPQFTHLLDLNYGSTAPTDDRIVKAHLNSMKAHLLRRGVSLIWKQEFTHSGRPHFHIVLDSKPDYQRCRKAWANIIGAAETSYLAKLETIRDQERLASYLVKPRWSTANRVAEGYSNMGRFWGCAGPRKAPEPLLTVKGDPARMEEILGLLCAKHESAGRYWPDNELYSRKIKHAGGEDAARLVNSYIMISDVQEPRKSEPEIERTV